MKRKTQSKEIRAGEKYTLLNQIINVISAAKLCNINKVDIPIWNKEFAYLPSLYCKSLDDIDEVVNLLKEHMYITIKPVDIYIGSDISNVDIKDESRYIRNYLLTISNINNIKYFGVSIEKATTLRNIFKKGTDLLYDEIKYELKKVGSILNPQNLDLDEITTIEKRNSYLCFMFAIDNLRKEGYRINLESSTYIDIANDDFLFFKRKIKKNVLSYKLIINSHANKINI